MGQLWSLAVGGQEKLVTTPIAAAIRDNNAPEVDHYSLINFDQYLSNHDLSLVVIHFAACKICATVGRCIPSSYIYSSVDFLKTVSQKKTSLLSVWPLGFTHLFSSP